MVACLVLTACAMGPTLVDHAFSVDAVRASPDAEVLNFRYGGSKLLGTHAQELDVQGGTIRQGTTIVGSMLRGDFLHVKWRIRKTGQVYEDIVNLRGRLPASITDHRIHFAIKGPQLCVSDFSRSRTWSLPINTRVSLQTPNQNFNLFSRSGIPGLSSPATVIGLAFARSTRRVARRGSR